MDCIISKLIAVISLESVHCNLTVSVVGRWPTGWKASSLMNRSSPSRKCPTTSPTWSALDLDWESTCLIRRHWMTRVHCCSTFPLALADYNAHTLLTAFTNFTWYDVLMEICRQNCLLIKTSNMWTIPVQLGEILIEILMIILKSAFCIISWFYIISWYYNRQYSWAWSSNAWDYAEIGLLCKDAEIDQCSVFLPISCCFYAGGQ